MARRLRKVTGDSTANLTRRLYTVPPGIFAQFWDGRAADVEVKAKGPVGNPVEMARASEEDVVAVLGSIPEYALAFRRAFPQDPEPVSLDNLGIAIGRSSASY